MQQRHGGVTRDREEFFDNPDLALQLNRRPAERYREVNLDCELRRAAGDDAGQDEKGRPIVALPDTATDYDPELVGKSPEEMAEILKGRSEAEDQNTARVMQQYPGHSEGVRHHGSNSGKRKQKPRPRVDHTKAAIEDVGEVAEKRPHPVAGRVSTEALAGLQAQPVNVGNILDAIGRKLYAGVSWAKIEFMLGDLCVTSSQPTSGCA